MITSILQWLARYLILGTIIAIVVYVTGKWRGADHHWTDRRDWKQISLATILVYPLTIPIVIWSFIWRPK